MNNLTISLCTVNDVSILSKLCRTTFQDTYSAYNTSEDIQQYLQVYFNENRLLDELSNPLIIYQIAWYNKQVSGYIRLNFAEIQTDVNDHKSLEIERIYVLKQMQGLKIGKALLEQAIALTKHYNLEYLWLGVWQKNTNAISFYKRQGFHKFATHTFILGQDEQLDDLMRFDIID